MPKEDCKYWDKCYQRNEYHLQKYNHPKAKTPVAGETSKQTLEEKPTSTTAKENNQQENKAPKRRSSGEATDEMEQSTNAEIDTSAEPQKFETAGLREEAFGNLASSGKNYMEILQKRIKLSVQAEYDELLRTNEFIRHKFLVEMPPDFYAFWKFAKSLVKKEDATGEDVLRHMEEKFHLKLVGPFEFLAGRFHNATIREPGDYLRHWRFFYDPPEFQTIFVRSGTGIHYGYWRDTPQDKDNLLIARNDAKEGCEFVFNAGNAFDAFLYYLEKDYPSTPFTVAGVKNVKKTLQAFMEANEVKVESLETLRKERNRKVVAKTFHRAGIVVPLDAKTELGYRPLLVSDAELKKILKLFENAGSKDDQPDDDVKAAVITKLQPVATAANIAMDEGDFGTSLELGIDLFCSGRLEMHKLVQSLVVPAYTLLHRPQFIAISKAHLDHRRRSFDLSIFDLDK